MIVVNDDLVEQAYRFLAPRIDLLDWSNRPRMVSTPTLEGRINRRGNQSGGFTIRAFGNTWRMPTVTTSRQHVDSR